MSYTTRFTPFTSFTIRVEMVFNTSCGSMLVSPCNTSMRARSLKSGVRPPDALYSQIARSRRKGDQMRQQAIATLGRDDELQASG